MGAVGVPVSKYFFGPLMKRYFRQNFAHKLRRGSDLAYDRPKIRVKLQGSKLQTGKTIFCPSLVA